MLGIKSRPLHRLSHGATLLNLQRKFLDYTFSWVIPVFLIFPLQHVFLKELYVVSLISLFLIRIFICASVLHQYCFYEAYQWPHITKSKSQFLVFTFLDYKQHSSIYFLLEIISLLGIRMWHSPSFFPTFWPLFISPLMILPHLYANDSQIHPFLTDLSYQFRLAYPIIYLTSPLRCLIDILNWTC